LVGSLIPDTDQALLDIIITSLAVTLMFAVLVLILKPSPDVDQLARNLISKFLRR